MRTVSDLNSVVKCGLVLLSIFFASVAFGGARGSVESVSDKYNNFALHLNVGLPTDNPDWVSTEQLEILRKLKAEIARFYGTQDDFVTIAGAVETSPDKYFVVATAGALNPKIRKYISLCPAPDQLAVSNRSSAKWLEGKTCNGNMLVVVDLISHTVRRIYNPKGPNSVSKDVYQYGCYQAFPLSDDDLDLDGTKDIFFVGGYGYGDEPNRWSILTIFSGNGYARLFSTRLNFEAWGDTGNNVYQNVVTEMYGKSRVSTPHPAHREFEKLFFRDFNKNGKLDILVWTRAYESRKTQDVVKGYELIDSSFKWYEQSDVGSAFVLHDISAQLAESWLQKYQLRWEDGFPSENLCERISHAKDQPFIDDVKSLHDPMLDGVN
jgi:hypothetical protein